MEQRSAFVVALIGLATATSACGGSSSNGDAAQGTERGPCYPNETCNAGLICLSDTCVMPPSSDAGSDATPDGTIEMDAMPMPGADSGTDGTPSGSDGGAEAGFPFAPSNIPLSAIDFGGVDDIELADTHGCVIDTGAGSISCDDAGIPARFHFAQVNQPGVDGGPAVPLGVFVANSLKIDAMVTVNVTSAPVLLDGGVPAPTPGLAFVAARDIDVEGTLRTGPAFEPWSTYAPYGTYAAGSRPPAPNFVDPAGGSFCGAGGPSNGNVNAPLLLPALIPLVGGQAGATNYFGVAFAAGGGAIELVAGGSLLVGPSGVISVLGLTDNYTNAGAYSIPGGSGGGVLLEASTVRVTGTLAADGATGGNGGGSGSSGTTINGGGGGTSGGGGAGTIRLNSRTGTATLDPQSTISPATSSPCFTEGMLR